MREQSPWELEANQRVGSLEDMRMQQLAGIHAAIVQKKRELGLVQGGSIVDPELVASLTTEITSLQDKYDSVMKGPDLEIGTSGPAKKVEWKTLDGTSVYDGPSGYALRQGGLNETVASVNQGSPERRSADPAERARLEAMLAEGDREYGLDPELLPGEREKTEDANALRAQLLALQTRQTILSKSKRPGSEELLGTIAREMEAIEKRIQEKETPS